MKNLFKARIAQILGIIAIVAVIGFSMIGCKDDDGGNTDPKTLVLTMPNANQNTPLSGFQLGVFPVGTTLAQAQARTGIVAGTLSAGTQSFDADSVTLTLPLYNINDDTRWTGNGTYDIYAMYMDVVSGGFRSYKKGSVNFSSATTYITMTASDEVTYP